MKPKQAISSSVEGPGKANGKVQDNCQASQRPGKALVNCILRPLHAGTVCRAMPCFLTGVLKYRECTLRPLFLIMVGFGVAQLRQNKARTGKSGPPDTEVAVETTSQVLLKDTHRTVEDIGGARETVIQTTGSAIGVRSS